LKRGGGNAGHNGLKDIDRALGSQDYLRVRIGVGRPPGRMPARDHVLRRFAPAERETMDVVLAEAGRRGRHPGDRRPGAGAEPLPRQVTHDAVPEGVARELRRTP
jgi:hypothetical protein